MENRFVINDRFCVDQSLHTVTDLQSGMQTKLEPRLVKLVMLLIAGRGQVVTRERIITEIWNDYGGAEDGLNQAISFLRKVFEDADKELIRTIPKKGYMLDATVSTQIIPRSGKRFLKKLSLYLVIATIALLGTIIYLLVRKPLSTDEGMIEPPGTYIDTTYQYQEMKEQADSSSKREYD